MISGHLPPVEIHYGRSIIADPQIRAFQERDA